jgi:succinate dehydrogenase/fumarate reductase flavoprotein subunit
MAIQKSEGLVPVNDGGLSTVPGLYAAGDPLGSYMSGGIYTQIGGSLAGSAVQGAMAGETAARASAGLVRIPAAETRLNQIQEEILAPLKRKKGYSPAWVTQVLQAVMISNFVLYIKKERMLNGALAYVEELNEHHVPMLLAEDRHQLRLAHETRNMIVTAEMKLKASLMRKESRCSHYRLDYPDVDTENWQAWINIYKDSNGTMQLEKQPFDRWPESI